MDYFRLPVLVVESGSGNVASRRDSLLGVREVAILLVHACVRDGDDLSSATQAALGVGGGRQGAARSGALLNAARAEVQQLHPINITKYKHQWMDWYPQWETTESNLRLSDCEVIHCAIACKGRHNAGKTSCGELRILNFHHVSQRHRNFPLS